MVSISESPHDLAITKQDLIPAALPAASLLLFSMPTTGSQGPAGRRSRHLQSTGLQELHNIASERLRHERVQRSLWQEIRILRAVLALPTSESSEDDQE